MIVDAVSKPASCFERSLSLCERVIKEKDIKISALEQSLFSGERKNERLEEKINKLERERKQSDGGKEDA